MIALIAAPAMAAAQLPTVPANDVDFPAFAAAVEACARKPVTEAIAAAGARHSAFLLSAYAEQRAIVAARGEVTARRARLRAGEKVERGEGEAAVAAAGQALDDRERALADARGLDRSEQELLGYLRGQYLTRCSGKSGS